MYAWLALAFQLSKCLFSDGISQLVLHQTQISKLYIIWRQFSDTRISNVTHKSNIIILELALNDSTLYMLPQCQYRVRRWWAIANSAAWKSAKFIGVVDFWHLPSANDEILMMTCRDSRWYLGPCLIYAGKLSKEIWLQLITGGGTMQQNTWLNVDLN